ncbi:hypothetical protein LSTR_LSTR003336 [Laodelphax striatellus]|uniref:RING-type domain-containing protein n=1 Tax=Laodelphax striatellus TaxID=195883 RepID=A0A482X5E2_LAOST|nr:hypothetical protein LSTR_LSTR003336 [Laodelphax striatellus]
MGDTISSQPHPSRKETFENRDTLEDEAAGSIDLSFSIDKDASRSTNADDSSTDGGSTPEKIDEVSENSVGKGRRISVVEDGKRSPLTDSIPGQNDGNEDHRVGQGLVNRDAGGGCNEFSKPGTKRPSVENESSSLKKMRLNTEGIKTENNPEITTTAEPSASTTDENSDLFGDISQLPNTSGYFNDLEKSVLEQVSSIANNSKEDHVEVLTQGNLSMEHLLKSNNCPLCLKWFDKIVVHVKNCAAKKKVTTDKLFDAIKLQLKQHQEREAIGLPPLVQQPPTKKKNKKKAVSIPEGYDSKLELAKALSASESQDSSGNVDAGNSTDSSAVDDNSKKSAPIFGSASSSGTSKLKGGSSLLFNRSEEDRERIVTEKVAIVLLHSDEQDNLITETAPVIPSSSKMKENLNKCAKASSKSDNGNLEKPSRFSGPISVRKLNKSSRSLKNNLRKLFEDRVMCDVSVIVEDGYEIEVHKLILRVQCPAMLDEVITRFVNDEAKKFIFWNDIPKDVAMAFFSFIYCEDLAEANNLTEERLKIFKDLVEKYEITGLKFIMKDVQIDNESDIETQVRDIDEATTATNSSGDELNNDKVVDGADNKFDNVTSYNSTPTLDKSKVVKYPLKKRQRNSDSNSCKESAKNLPSFTNITTRSPVSKKSHASYHRSREESSTIDCHSADSTDDVQIIGEQKKDAHKKIPDVITLSDDSDDGNKLDDTISAALCRMNTPPPCESVKRNTPYKITPAARMRAVRSATGIGSKRIWESSDSESEEGSRQPFPRPFQNKESSRNIQLASFNYGNGFRGDRHTIPDLQFPSTSDLQLPSTSKAAAQFDYWTARNVTSASANHKTDAEQQSSQTVSNSKSRESTNLENELCDANSDDILDLPHIATPYNLFSQMSNSFAMNAKVYNPFSDPSWMADDEDTISQRFQRFSKDYAFNKNTRKRRCSATITRSELDAMTAGLEDPAQKSDEFSDPSRSPVEAERNVSLLNGDEELFKNVQTPDTSATNNAPEMKGHANYGGLYSQQLATSANKVPVVANEMEQEIKNKESSFETVKKLFEREKKRFEEMKEFETGVIRNLDLKKFHETMFPILPKPVVEALPTEQVDEVAANEVEVSLNNTITILKNAVNNCQRMFPFLDPRSPELAPPVINKHPEAPANNDKYAEKRFERLVENEAPVNEDLAVPANEIAAEVQVGEDEFEHLNEGVDEMPPLAPADEIAGAPDAEDQLERVGGVEVPVDLVAVPPAPAPVGEAPLPILNVAGNHVRENNDLLVEPVHSPKPNFNKMKKFELMQHLEKYGVKTNMTCARARKLLTHIYDFTHQEVKVVRGKKLSTKKEYNAEDLQRMIDNLEGNYKPREIPEPEVNGIAGTAENGIPDVGPGPGSSSRDDGIQNEIRLTVLEQVPAMIGGENISDTYRELLELENKRVIINTEDFECPTCFDIIEIGGGVVLKDCAHSICRTCLSRLVESSDEVAIKCPCCTSIIQEREIKEVVAPGIFEKYLSKSLAVTANSIENAFHCKTPDCRGWCIIDDVINQPVNVFNCPLCGIANCVQCQATHPSMNCLQYQNQLAIQAEKDPIAKKSLLYLENLKKNRKALNCPKCQIVIVKTEGCDWIQCSMCKCEICWATMGPRWGPRGFGDESGGCRCKLNRGAPCTPTCRNCH